jgi:hypothetical protein
MEERLLDQVPEGAVKLIGKPVAAGRLVCLCAEQGR